jgi:hypothetical protein
MFDSEVERFCSQIAEHCVNAVHGRNHMGNSNNIILREK